MSKVRKCRDLTLVEMNGDNLLVIACDSLGAIGTKEEDYLKTSGSIVGRFTVRVPLMEVMAAGAVPLLIINTLSVEMDPTGKDIIAGIREELTLAGLADLTVTGSTEENMPTRQTGVGITVIGKAAAADLRLGKVQVGDPVYCLGQPRVGSAVLAGVVPDVPLLKKLLAQPWGREILPVGSKGVLYEAGQLASTVQRKFSPAAVAGLDLYKSAGPATSLLVATEGERLAELREIADVAVFPVGTIQ